MTHLFKKVCGLVIVICSLSVFNLYAQEEEGPSLLYVQIMKNWAEVTNFAENAAKVSASKFAHDLKRDPQIADYVTEQLVLDLQQFFYEIFVSEDTIRKIARLYSEYFSIDELQELIAFYKTPIGQKLVETNPVIANRSQQIGDEILKSKEKQYVELISKHILEIKKQETQSE